MNDLNTVHLVLFMTRGMSLAGWEAGGMFDREVALYEALREYLGRITLVSFGGRADQRFRSRLPGISIVSNRWRLPGRIYEYYVSRILPRFWKGKIIVKSNQMAGANLVVRAAQAAGGKSLARCGYMLSLNTGRVHGVNSRAAMDAVALEREVYSGADMCIVTTEVMQRQVLDYGVSPSRISTIPNYIVEDFFLAPAQVRNQVLRIGFVGRLEKEKNVLNMIKALKGLKVELVVAGRGSLEQPARDLAGRLGISVEFIGNVGHQKVVKMLSSCDLYLQPSRYEGHPKSILEAMACGLPVIAGDSPGISSFIEHGKTAWLCGMEVEDIRKSVITVMEDYNLRKAMAANARKYALSTVGLSRVLDMELDVYRKLLARD